MSSTSTADDRPAGRRLLPFMRRSKASASLTPEEAAGEKQQPERWNMGMLNDKYTHEVPGSVLLLTGKRNEPLGLQNAPARNSSSSIHSRRSHQTIDRTKKTSDGTIILEPQPDDSSNDPLNWPSWRRDTALISLGIYCMVGGGMTPILAAGFSNVSDTFNVSESRVALTTGLYMMGLGMGSVFASPTAILYGKRPVYLVGAILFIGTSCWCAASPSFGSLLAARVFQGMSLSPVECLPSATIAEIFFLHERAWRIGIYTLLLLSGKNLVPLVSAAIIQSLGWRWVFWIVAFVGAFCLVFLFLFVPETFWDRTPRPKTHSRAHHARPSILERLRLPSMQTTVQTAQTPSSHPPETMSPTAVAARTHKKGHVGFAQGERSDDIDPLHAPTQSGAGATAAHTSSSETTAEPVDEPRAAAEEEKAPAQPFGHDGASGRDEEQAAPHRPGMPERYTSVLRQRPTKTFAQQLKVFNGQLHHDNWFKVAVRPFILFSYPAVLWASIVYACSIGWLIVLSESVSIIYRSADTYNFSALSAGLIYISPFIGGILGTAVAGRLSDVIVRYMARRNGGLYEPEFRLVMAAPVAVTTVIGLMGYGWSAQLHDSWIVPTVFFGIISFGCSLGSTTSITFCVDSYRQYAGEALVTLNFTKNICHGLVFSLFFNSWLTEDGSKTVFIAIGVIQLGLLLFTIPMYIYGKRARMWTVRKNFMEKF